VGATVAKVGGMALIVGLALFAVASTSAGQSAYGSVASALGGDAPDVSAATAARMTASTDFASKKQASLAAADAATSAEAAADAADAKAKSARDKAILARTQALNARVDKARAAEAAVSGYTAGAQDAAVAAKKKLNEAKAAYREIKTAYDDSAALIASLETAEGASQVGGRWCARVECRC
jgi:hypothetical protein